MKRYMYRAQTKTGSIEPFLGAFAAGAAEAERALREAGALTYALYRWERELFVYLEAEGEREAAAFPLWPEEAAAFLERWPGEAEPRTETPMLDIFHDGVPVDVRSWREGRIVERRVGSLARLKPEQYASYVFYHYQMQEERPESFNQTYMIGSHERYIFSYAELPASKSGRPRRGLLDTDRTPPNWQDVMDPHFEMWTDPEHRGKPWRRMDCVHAF